MVELETHRENIRDNIVGSVPVYLDVAELSPKVSAGMTAYYHARLDNPQDPVHYNNMHRLAFYKTIEHTLFAVFLYDVNADKFLFNEGYYSSHVPVLLKSFMHHLLENGKSKSFEAYIEENLYEFELRLNIFNSKKYVFGVVAVDLQSKTEALNYIEKLFYRFYLRKNDLVREFTCYDCIPDINHRLNLQRNYSKDNSLQMYLILIEIEPLKKYIHVAGDYLVNEIIRNVKMEIKKIIGGLNHCYIMNSRQYLLSISGMEESAIKEIFKQAHFRIKNVLLVYRMKIFEIKDLNKECNLYDQWSDLKIQ